MDDGERLRLDYEQTTQLLRSLTDIRFRLLAFVPTIAGASIGLVGNPSSAGDLLAVGALGLVATLGILVYELRNSQIQEAALEQATRLERELGIASGLGAGRPAPTHRLAAVIPVRQSVGLALVYGAALAGWTYLVVWGFLRALDAGGARTTGGVVGIVVGAFVVWEIARPHD